MDLLFTNKLQFQQIQQNTLGQMAGTQFPLTVKTPASIWPNFSTANQGYSILNNLLGSFGMTNSNSMFSPAYFSGMNSFLEKFLTIKKPLTAEAATVPQQPTAANTAEKPDNHLDIHNHGDGTCKTTAEADLTPKAETPAKPAQAEAPVVKQETASPKIDPRLLGPTCYLTGGPIAGGDLTPKQFFARKQAEDNNKETLSKLS